MPASSAILLALAVGALPAQEPTHAMQLKPCPSTPNCVSTQAIDSSKRMGPIPFEGSAAKAHATLMLVLRQPRVEVVESTFAEDVTKGFGGFVWKHCRL